MADVLVILGVPLFALGLGCIIVGTAGLFREQRRRHDEA